MIPAYSEQYLGPSKSNEILKRITKLNAKKFEHKTTVDENKVQVDISNYSKLTDLAYSSLSAIEEAIVYFGDVRNPLFFSKITSSAGRLLQNFRQMYGLMRSLLPVFNFIPPTEFGFLSEVNVNLHERMREFHDMLGKTNQESVADLFLQAYEKFLDYYNLFEASKRQYNFGKAQQNITPMESRVPLFLTNEEYAAEETRKLERKRGRLPGPVQERDISDKELREHFGFKNVSEAKKKFKTLAGKKAVEIYHILRDEYYREQEVKADDEEEPPELEETPVEEGDGMPFAFNAGGGDY